MRKVSKADRFAVSIYVSYIEPLRARGLSCRRIARFLNSKGVLTAYKKGRWQASRISEIESRVRSLDPEVLAELSAEHESQVSDQDFPPSDRDPPPSDRITLPREIIERAVSGDQKAVRDLRSILGVSSEFWGEFLNADREINRSNRCSLGHLDALASSPWEHMLIDCLRAHSLRLGDKTPEGLALLDSWLRREGGHPCARAELQRRRCRPLIVLGRQEEALDAALEASQIYRQVGWPGLDPYEHGLEDSLLALGEIYYLLGRHFDAVSTFRTALSTVDSAFSPALQGLITFALAVGLSKIGSEEAMAEARSDLRQVRQRFFRKESNRGTTYMARLDWFEGSLIWRTAKRNRHRAREMVRRGRDLLTELQMPLDAACCALDLELMWRPQHREEARCDLAVWHEKAKAILSPDVDEEISGISKALAKAGYFAWEDFLSLVREVRKAFGKKGSVLPSFVSDPRRAD